jgi:hypothetical protein
LFSPPGKKFLKALLEYHIVPDKTLYSTAFYDGPAKDDKTGEDVLEFMGRVIDDVDAPDSQLLDEVFDSPKAKRGCHGKDKGKKEVQTEEEDDETAPPPHKRPPPPYVHYQLPTLLDKTELSVDLFRHGPFASIKVNALVRVVVKDGIARDGVVQVVNRVLIPPRKPGGKAEDFEQGEVSMSVEEFVERMTPYVDDAAPDKDEIKLEF